MEESKASMMNESQMIKEMGAIPAKDRTVTDN
jgi:hypothetical protein